MILTESFGNFVVSNTGLYVVEVDITLVKETLLASGIKISLFETGKTSEAESVVVDFGVTPRTDGLVGPLGTRQQQHLYRRFFKILDSDIDRGSIEAYDGSLNRTIVDRVVIREATEDEKSLFNS